MSRKALDLFPTTPEIQPMAKTQTAPLEVDAPEVGDDPAAVLADRQRRLADLRADLQRLDADEQTCAAEIGVLLARGEDPSEAQTRRRAIRENLEDLHVALPVVERLVALAAEGVALDQADKARAKYHAARQVEADAARTVQEALEALGGALAKLREAGRAAYALGNTARLETSTDYRRRLSAIENAVATTVGETCGTFRVAPKLRVPDLPGRLADLLPKVTD